MKLRVFEAFAGYGSQSIALGLLSENSRFSKLKTISQPNPSIFAP